MEFILGSVSVRSCVIAEELPGRRLGGEVQEPEVWPALHLCTGEKSGHWMTQ